MHQVELLHRRLQCARQADRRRVVHLNTLCLFLEIKKISLLPFRKYKEIKRDKSHQNVDVAKPFHGLLDCITDRRNGDPNKNVLTVILQVV